LREKIIAHNGVSWLGELGISDSRTLLVPGGLAIMIACMQCLTIDRIYYRDVALREGVLYEMLEQMRHPNIRLRTRKSMQSRYSTDTAHAERVTDTVSAILQRVPAAWLGSKDDVHEILYEAAHLHEVGLQISAGGLQKHSAYILASSDLPGYNEEQQLLLASLVGAHRKKIRLDDLPKLRIIEPPALLRLIIVLRLAIIFNITRWPINLAYVELSVKPDGLHIVVDEKLIATQQLLEADLQRESDLLAAVNFNLIIR
jgi:exopolyphosphatase/guanosine-5'-triphosphate,3'-diphosphate pyrophosphatase